MFAGFLPLIFNPQAWIVVGITALLSFSGGVVKGWSWSNADQWRTQAEELVKASKQKDDIIALDQVRAFEADARIAQQDAILEAKLHEPDPAACHINSSDLVFLRKLAAGSNSNGNALSGTASRHKAASKP